MPKDHNGHFKGFIMSVVEYSGVDNSVNPVGTFGSEHENAICDGTAVTHNNASLKTRQEFRWIAPEDSSGKIFKTL